MPQLEEVPQLEAMTWPEAEALTRDSIVAVPIGSTEQHGPHLPLGTDSEVAVALCRRLAQRCGQVVVAPLLPYGASGEHAGFPGTVSIGSAALASVLIELGRSLDRFDGVVFISAHGGNADALAEAVGTLRAEGRHILSWAPRVPGGDAHAGRTETSLMLALKPTAVRHGQAQAGDTRSLAALLPRLRAEGVAAVSPNVVLGDPSGASAEEGAALLDALADDLARAVEERWQ
ncbi:MAG TPA: mycofactocin biosynthesis peptidyl-dipeptidase MftE [Acidimicrobiales bacterium]|nr:mycofactocin biosynthesis peptidyl-dipeptidase MftE [Acidimicrobiales bacterium]